MSFSFKSLGTVEQVLKDLESSWGNQNGGQLFQDLKSTLTNAFKELDHLAHDFVVLVDAVGHTSPSGANLTVKMETQARLNPVPSPPVVSAPVDAASPNPSSPVPSDPAAEPVTPAPAPPTEVASGS